MNSKTAKKLRRKAAYLATVDGRSYIAKKHKGSGRVTIECKPGTERAVYKLLKKGLLSLSNEEELELITKGA